MVSNYLFSLSMGLVGVILIYLDSLQNKQKVTKTNYIKVFIAASIISLITSEFYKAGVSLTASTVSTLTGGSKSGITRQEILTGNPDF